VKQQAIMMYLVLFGTSYALSFLMLSRRQARLIRGDVKRLRSLAVDSEGIGRYRETVNRESRLLLIWSAFFFGSIAGSLLSLIFGLLVG
jgi:hypothetical protein